MYSRKLLALVLFALFFVTCKKDHDVGGLSSQITFTPNSGLAGTMVTIKGHGFSPDTAANKVVFNGVDALVRNASDTQLIVVVPVGTTGPVAVTVGGRTVKGDVYTYQALSIHGIRPAEGFSGMPDTISGAGFLYSDKGQDWTPAVYFNGVKAYNLSVSDTQIVVAVPDKSGSGPVSITLGDLKAQGASFTYLQLDTIKPLSGNTGTVVRLRGVFGSHYKDAIVTFNGRPGAMVSVSDTLLVAKAPAADTTGRVNVNINGVIFHGPVFRFIDPPIVSGYNPTSGPAGTKVTITGQHFSIEDAENLVSFNGIASPSVVPGTETSLTAVVPAGATTGAVTVVTNDHAGTGPAFVVQGLGVWAVTPSYFVAPLSVTLSGIGFSTTPASNTVTFNGVAGVVTAASDTQLVVKVPYGVMTGHLSVSAGGLSTSGPGFSTVAIGTVAGIAGSSGLTNGDASVAQFVMPMSLALDASGNIYVADAGANNIRKVTRDGVVSVFAGDEAGSSGNTDGAGAEARFAGPDGLVFDGVGNLYVADQGNSSIRKIAANGTVSTFAVLPDTHPMGLAFDGSGNLLVADYTYGGGVHKLDPSGNDLGIILTANGGLFTGVVVDAQGNIYVTNISPNQQGAVYRNGQQIATLPFDWSNFNGARQLAIDRSGRVLVVDSYGHSLLAIDPANSYAVSRIIGNDSYTPGYQDGPLSSALLNAPTGIAVDAAGIIYICETGNYTVRKVSLK